MSTSVVKNITSEDGTAIYADAIGDPSKPQIVFIHGLCLSGAVFDDVFADVRYSSEFYMVRYDMRGHGRSGKPEAKESYLSERYAEDYLAVAREFSLKKPLFVGWSMGATVLVDIAQYLPRDTLSGVVYLTGLPYVGDIMREVGTSAVMTMSALLCKNDDATMYIKTKVDFIDSLFSDPDSVPYDLKMFWLGISIAQAPVVTQRVVSRPQDPAALFAWAKEGLPLLILVGSEDKQISADALSETMKRHFTNMTVRIFDGLGHALFYEDPDGVYSAMFGFARELAKTS